LAFHDAVGHDRHQRRLPDLAGRICGSLGEAQWIISVYVLAIGITTPLSASGQPLHRQSCYVAGLAVFAVARYSAAVHQPLQMVPFGPAGIAPA